MKQVDVPIRGMDCAQCTHTVHQAVAGLEGVESVEVSLTTEQARVQYDPELVDLSAIQAAVEAVGYRALSLAPHPGAAPGSERGSGNDEQAAPAFTRRILTLLGIIFAVVLLVAVAGEWLGLIDAVTTRVPWPVGLALTLIGGYPVFRKVAAAALRRQVTSHTLMTVGVAAALIVGQWATALLVVFFMRMGDHAERFTMEKSRGALRHLTDMAPSSASVLRDGVEETVPIGEVRIGDTVLVRSGGMISVDGEVVDGRASVDQASITGESLPVEAGPGTQVFAATTAAGGHLRVRATEVGRDTTFGRVVQMVQEAEANRAQVQRVADAFARYYLPFVAGVAGLTFLVGRDPLATAAVLVVACSCSFALATPVAILASVGAAARRGLLIKGGRYLELLAQADVVLIDKTGTVSLGRPQLTRIISLDGVGEGRLLELAAAAERYSEHPLAAAVVGAARERGVPLREPVDLDALPSLGVRAWVGDTAVAVGSRRMFAGVPLPPELASLEEDGSSVLVVALNGKPAGALVLADTLRPEAPEAVAALRNLGVQRVEMLTGDHEAAAATVATALGVEFQAGLLPEDKLRIVKDYQAAGHTVVMVGDGINDAAALAQADVGVAMRAPHGGVAMEAAHVVLMRDDWLLVPELLRIARRTLQVVKTNIAFTGVYNAVGLTLAAIGLLPLFLAAAAQSLPDLGILGNSARLLRQK